jgi:transposase
VTSSRRLEQQIREDLGFRYLAGGAQPDHWTLNEFRRRQAKALNDLFTQVVELARAGGRGRLGHVAIDSTRVKAKASPNRVEREEKLRAEGGGFGAGFGAGFGVGSRPVTPKTRTKRRGWN